MDSTTATETRNTIRVYRSVNSSVQSQLATREGSNKFFKRHLDRDPRYGWQELDRVPRVRLPR